MRIWWNTSETKELLPRDGRAKLGIRQVVHKWGPDSPFTNQSMVAGESEFTFVNDWVFSMILSFLSQEYAITHLQLSLSWKGPSVSQTSEASSIISQFQTVSDTADVLRGILSIQIMSWPNWATYALAINPSTRKTTYSLVWSLLGIWLLWFSHSCYHCEVLHGELNPTKKHSPQTLSQLPVKFPDSKVWQWKWKFIMTDWPILYRLFTGASAV